MNYINFPFSKPRLNKEFCDAKSLESEHNFVDAVISFWFSSVSSTGLRKMNGAREYDDNKLSLLLEAFILNVFAMILLRGT